jgi:hypothetical protein
MAGDEVKNGMIIISHNNIKDYDDWAVAERKLKRVIESLKGSGLRIEYSVLDAFVS